MMLPNLTPAEAERLAILSEECGEIILAIGKILRHGYASLNPFDPEGPTNREQLVMELGDIIASIDLFLEAGDGDWEAMNKRIPIKWERLKTYTHHQPPALFDR